MALIPDLERDAMRGLFRLLACVLLVGVTGLASARAEPVRVATGEWPPFISERLPHGGPVLRIVRDAFAAVEMDVEFMFRPWNRALYMARRGQAAATAVWGPAESRQADFLFSAPVLESPLSFLHRRDRPFDWSSYDDLRGLRVGVVLGNRYTPGFHAAEAEGVFQTFTATTEVDGLRALLAGRVDVFVVNRTAGYRLAREIAPDAPARITHHSKPLRLSTYHVLFAREAEGAAALRQRFNEGLRILREQGRVEAIYKAMEQRS